MAAFLNRGLGHASVDTNLASIPGAESALLGSASLTLTGPTTGAQGVLVQVFVALDHDDPLAIYCSANLSLRLTGSATEIDEWVADIHPSDVGKEEQTAAAFYTTQPSGTTRTYEIWGGQTCGQTIFTDKELLIVQNIPFSGAGGGVVDDLDGAQPDTDADPGRR